MISNEIQRSNSWNSATF